MQVIAISYSGYDNVVGDIIVVGTLADESWFNTFRSYWSKNALSIRLKRGVLFEKLGDKLINHIVRRTKNKDELPILYMDVLNSFKEFWKYKIYIESPNSDIVDLMNKHIPNNLKDKVTNLYNCDIKFSQHRALALAWALAEEYSFQQDEMLKKVWGDTGKNRIEDEVTLKFINERKDCVHIRDQYRIREEENEKPKEQI